MKKRSFILVVLMVICSAFCLVGCGKQGPQGEKGDKGDPGIQGMPGVNGEDGKDGHDGKPGDKGPQGIQGIQGEKGDQGEPGQDGREVEFMVDATGIKWHYVGETEWRDLLTFEDLDGYSRTYNITFDEDGGKAVEDMKDLIFKTKVTLPVAEKEGFHFLGWRAEGVEELLNGEIEVRKDLNLKAVWAYTVELDLNGGAIKGKFDTVQEVKEAFIADYNTWGDTAYTTETSVLWHGNLFKFFQDPVYGPLWAPLLQYIIDVETEYKTNVLPTLDEKSQAKFDLYEWFDDLVAGKDLMKLNKNVAPYCITYSMHSFLRNKQEIGAWHICADYSTDEVQNKVIDYFIPSKDTTLYIEVGTQTVLPAVGKADVNFRGFFDGEVQVPGAYTPEKNVTLKATFGAGVALNTNVDEENPVIEENVPAMIVVAEDGADVALPVITRNNYKFLGWFNGAEKVETITKATSFTALKAKWEGNAHTVKFNGSKDPIEDLATVYGNKVGTMPAGVKDGMVFDGWWTLDGSESGEWGEQVTASTVVKDDLVLYAKFKQPYTVTLNYNGGLRPVINGAEVRAAFVKDFYDFLIAQNVFTADTMPYAEFVGENYNGKWFNYCNPADNPSTLYPGYEVKGAYLFGKNAEGKITTEVMEGATSYMNTAEGNAKYADFFKYVEKIFNADRVWTNISQYGMHDFGRYMQSFNGANPYVSEEMMAALPTGCEKTVVAVGGADESLTVYSLTEDNALPTPTREGLTFKGWEVDGKLYTAITEETLNGKTLVAKFVYTATYVHAATFESVRAEFIADFNAKSGRVVAADGSDFFARSYGGGLNAFMTAEGTMDKWGWLLNAINDYAVAQGKTSFITDGAYVADMETHGRSNIHGFLVAGIKEGWPASADFATQSQAIIDAAPATVVATSVVEYDVNAEATILVANAKTGYTFDGWYANAEFTGEKVTTVTPGMTVYAKYVVAA